MTAGGLFAPIDRPRVTAHLRRAASRPVTVLAAPAGYGKSVALRQYLGAASSRVVRFDVRAEQCGFPAFAAGLSAALAREIPVAKRAFSLAPPGNPERFAQRIAGLLEGYDGIVAVDDLHHALADTNSVRFLVDLIDATKPRVQWLLSTRSASALPIATWLAYGDLEFVVDEKALAFTRQETHRAGRSVGRTISREGLDGLQRLTGGWPVGIGFGLRASLQEADERACATVTREMMYRFIDEQIYATLDADEREMLEVSSALPAMDVKLLERAGFDRALAIAERLRERAALIFRATDGVYRCDDLLVRFVRRQIAHAGAARQAEVHARAARALEEAGDAESAVRSWAEARSKGDLLRALKAFGFELVERARTECVASALEALDDRTRREEAHVLALRGLLHAAAGRISRADQLLRRSIARAREIESRELAATLTLKLALLVANRHGDVGELLREVAEDAALSADFRAEAYSLLAAARAVAGDPPAAKPAIESAVALLPHVDADATRARVLQRLGVSELYTGEAHRAQTWLLQAAELATELHLHSLASRAYSSLSMLACHHFDDLASQRSFAERAATAAREAEGAFDLESALMQLLSIEMRCGNAMKASETEKQILDLQISTSSRQHYLVAFRAERSAWDGNFDLACDQLGKVWSQFHHDFDRVICGSQYALFLAAAGRRAESISKLKDVSRIRQDVRGVSRFSQRILCIARLYCVLAELINGRPIYAERHADELDRNNKGIVERSVVRICESSILGIRVLGGFDAPLIRSLYPELNRVGYGGLAMTLQAILPFCLQIAPKPLLTGAESIVLNLLAQGRSPKEIAMMRHNSVNTIRVHIANAITKLCCSGQIEAIAKARQLGLIS